MADPALPGDADIVIELDGKEMVLRPSLKACMAVSRIAGGLQAAVQRCLALDMDTICAIITAGLDLNPNQARMVPEAVYATGLIALSAPCIDFINVVGNGGRPVQIEEDDDDDGESADPPQPASP